MRTYITRINGWSLRDESCYIQHMVSEIAHQLGCREMGIYRYNSDGESWGSRSSRLDGIIAGINRGDLIICQFPTGNGLRFDNDLVDRLKAYGGRVAIFVQELETLTVAEKRSLLREIINLYNKAEVLIVPTYAMQQWLLENGIQKRAKFVVQEMWDYPVDGPAINKPVLKKEIYFTDSGGFIGMNDWSYAVPLKLFNVSARQRDGVQNLGGREPHQLFYELSAGGFGLVWYRDEYSRQHMEQIASFPLARYLAAGIPVIVPAENSHLTLVEENHLGLAVNSLDEAVAAVEKMTEGEYQEYVDAVERFAPALRNGYYTKKCLVEAMQAFYRRDAGRIPIPERDYKIGECAFGSVVLNDSYGGNLALSWEFQGEADGFLIYDMAGMSLGSTRDIHQHYYLLKGQERKNGFIIKAYVETFKGRLVLAESKPVYLKERRYGYPKVSMVIPAYDAEDYIVRCIDTVLAQSQADIEIIIVDDGSVDRTPEIIDWYARRYDNIVAIHQENSGAAGARNAGIKQAKGEYIGFVDSDDMVRPDMVKGLYQAAKKEGCDIAITSVYRITEGGYETLIWYPLEEGKAIQVDDFLRMLNARKWMFSIVVWNKLYKASLVKNRLIPSLTIGEDTAWTPYILSHADRICYLNDYSYEHDRTIRTSTLGDTWKIVSKEERFMNYRNIVLFYLQNGKPERIHLLKEYARQDLLGMGRAYQDDAYEKLWRQLDADF